MPKSKPEKTQLVQMIESFIAARTGETRHSVAKAAGVSVNSLSRLLAGQLVDTGGLKSAKGQTLRGHAEVLARLAQFVELDPGRVLREYGLDPTATTVAGALSRVEDRQAQRGRSDPVIDTIRRRGGKVRLGFLRWPPFLNDKEAVANSWAYRYVTRLIGAVHPHWEHEALTAFGTITESMDALWRKAEACDVVFGLYDTPFRRLSGLSFIDLPGLGVPLGALHDPEDGDLIWEDLLHPTEHLRRRLVPSAIRDEVGHLFMAGVCGYREPDIKIVSEATTEGLARAFVCHLARVRDRQRKGLFVADALGCDRLRGFLASSVTPSWISKLPSLTVREREGLHEAARRIVPVEDENEVVPTYRLGVAVRDDATRWEELLRLAQTEELFRNAHNATAADYAEILGASIEVHPLPLEPALSTSSAQRFARACIARLQELPKAADDQVKRCTAIWLSNGATSDVSSKKTTASSPRRRDGR